MEPHHPDAEHGATQADAAAAQSQPASPLLELDAAALAHVVSDASFDGSTALAVDVIDMDDNLTAPSQACGAHKSEAMIFDGDVSVLALMLKESHQQDPTHVTSSIGKTQRVIRTQTMELQPNQCAYRNGLCRQPRTLKSNGALHSLCEQHRQRSLDNQKRFDQKQRVRRLCEQLQVKPDTVEAVQVVSNPVESAKKTQNSSPQLPIKRSRQQDAAPETTGANGESSDPENYPSKRLTVYII